MKKMAVLFISVALFGHGRAQSPSQSLQDTLLRMYNSNNYTGIYNLGSTEWKLRHDTACLAGWLGWMHGQTGRLLSSSLVSDAGKFIFFRWNGERKVTAFMLAFMLEKGDHGGYNDFYFASFKQPLSAEELRQVYSDNPLKTPLDSAIHK